MEPKKMKRIVVYLTSEVAAWLDLKAQEGYKKASLVRHILEGRMKLEGEKHGN